MLNRKGNDFWNWFNLNNELLSSNNINNDLIELLDNKILALGDFNWEIREGLIKKNMLIISSGGNKELFQSAKHIIGLAPNIPTWEFSHYKPAKVWDFSLSIKDTLGFGDNISVSNWEYVLLKFPDSTFDIIVKCPNINNLKDDDKYTLIDIVLENILGDEISYNFIKNVEIVNDFEDKYKNSKTSIVNLKEHFFSIL